MLCGEYMIGLLCVLNDVLMSIGMLVSVLNLVNSVCSSGCWFLLMVCMCVVLLMWCMVGILLVCFGMMLYMNSMNGVCSGVLWLLLN